MYANLQCALKNIALKFKLTCQASLNQNYIWTIAKTNIRVRNICIPHPNIKHLGIYFIFTSCSNSIFPFSKYKIII